jgi:hypothetical protein
MLGSGRRSLIGVALLPLLLTALYLYVSFSRAQASASTPRPVASERAALDRECDFPGAGAERKRLVIVIVDSLRDITAFDWRIMPWLSNHRGQALFGRMQPCLSQLSLLCFRTMFEGSEPLLVTGFKNYTGMSVEAPSLIHRLGARGIRVAAVADHAFIGLYQPSLAKHASFEEREPKSIGRDAYGRNKTFEWLADPSLDVIISHVIDTDATAHRVGIRHAQYAAKFRETDDFLRGVAGKLGPRDSLIVLGDHGHDEHGYHSTGIPSVTAYFASGPLFPGGRRHDLHMSGLYFLAGAVTCEATPINYAGTHPFDELNWPGGRRQALEQATPEVRKTPRPTAQASWAFDATVLALGGVLFWLLLSALRAPLRLLLVFGGVALAWSVTHGWLSPKLLVTLQNQVNPTWTIGFWVCFWLLALPLALLVARWLSLPRTLAIALTVWAAVLYGLFLGPYYYGSLRNLAFGVNVLLLMLALTAFRGMGVGRWRSPLVRWCLLAVLPTIPLLAPVLKEWQPRWVVLSFAEPLGPLPTAGVALLFLGLGALLAPERKALRAPAIGVACGFVLGVLTQIPSPVLLAASLLQLSYLGFWRALDELPELGLPKPSLLAVGQASYAFILYFLLLGSLRFANVDFSFALAFTPIDEGELAAALGAIPFVQLKYFLPIVILLSCGPKLRPEALAVVLLKVLALGAVLVGMEIAASPSLLLFVQLQTQELALTVLLYAVLVACVAASLLRERLRAGSRGPAVVEGAGA